MRFRVMPACCVLAVALAGWAIHRHAGGRQREPVCEVTSWGSNDDSSFTVEGDAVHVHARMTLVDRRDCVTYVWRVQVRRQPEDEVIINVPYLAQGFRVDPANPRTVTFDDTFRPGPGTHTVYLSLFEVPDPGRGVPADLDAPELPRDLAAGQGARVLDTVTVH